jgi:hypothetical protein
MRNYNELPLSIKKEFATYLLDLIHDGVLTNENREDWHFHAFNEDYYIIGYYEAEQWLKRHEISTFEAIGFCQEYEEGNFGEITSIYDNAERVVNMLAYIFGEFMIWEHDSETVEQLKESLSEYFD